MSTNNFSPYPRFAMVAVVLAILASLLGSAVQPAAASAPAAAEPASLSVVGVVAGKSVTIKVINMPANKEFRVRMNVIGTKGIDGTIAGTARTNQDGSFTATFAIPSQLKDKSTIAIRIEATDKTGWYAYNWFYNRTSGSSGGSAGGSTGGGSVPSGGVSSGNLSVVEVVEDVSVSVQVRNAPANSTLSVWMDWKNRRGALLGVRVGSIKSDKNGSLSGTFKMPVSVKDRRELRIRLQGPTGSNYAAYRWFLNVNSDENTGGSAPAGYEGGLPYLLVSSVVKNGSASIEAYNLPKGDYKVSMGRFGTQAKNGIEVGTIKHKQSGVITGTFEIPRDLRDRERIAIRIQGAGNSAYYAYAWFYNAP